MSEERNLIRVFVEIDKKESEIAYYRGFWEGPKVTPRRFYPPRLVKLVGERDGENREYIPNPSDLRSNAPLDSRINAYILGDRNFFSVQTHSSVVEAVPGQKYSRGGILSHIHLGHDGDGSGQQLVCVTYCMLSQRDLDKVSKEKPE